MQSLHLSCDFWRSKKPLEAGRSTHRCVNVMILGSMGCVHDSFQRPEKEICSVAKRNIVRALQGLKSDFWATESRMLIAAKPALCVSTGS